MSSSSWLLYAVRLVSNPMEHTTPVFNAFDHLLTQLICLWNHAGFSGKLQFFPLVATFSEISLVFWLLLVESTIHLLFPLISNLLLVISGEILPLSFVNWMLSCFSRSISIFLPKILLSPAGSRPLHLLWG